MGQGAQVDKVLRSGEEKRARKRQDREDSKLTKEENAERKRKIKEDKREKRQDKIPKKLKKKSPEART